MIVDIVANKKYIRFEYSVPQPMRPPIGKHGATDLPCTFSKSQTWDLGQYGYREGSCYVAPLVKIAIVTDAFSASFQELDNKLRGLSTQLNAMEIELFEEIFEDTTKKKSWTDRFRRKSK